jgi:hypothetical protein
MNSKSVRMTQKQEHDAYVSSFFANVKNSAEMMSAYTGLSVPFCTEIVLGRIKRGEAWLLSR